MNIMILFWSLTIVSFIHLRSELYSVVWRFEGHDQWLLGSVRAYSYKTGYSTLETACNMIMTCIKYDNVKFLEVDQRR